MSEEIKKMSIKEFRKLGYLQEVNRGFFHPHGLALEIAIDEDGNESLGGIWDYRDDPEGVCFATSSLSTPEAHHKAQHCLKELEKHREAREKLFGDIQQPLGY